MGGFLFGVCSKCCDDDEEGGCCPALNCKIEFRCTGDICESNGWQELTEDLALFLLENDLDFGGGIAIEGQIIGVDILGAQVNCEIGLGFVAPCPGGEPPFDNPNGQYRIQAEYEFLCDECCDTEGPPAGPKPAPKQGVNCRIVRQEITEVIDTCVTEFGDFLGAARDPTIGGDIPELRIVCDPVIEECNPLP